MNDARNLRGPGLVHDPDNPTIHLRNTEKRFITDVRAHELEGHFDFIIVGSGAGGCGFLSGLIHEILKSPRSKQTRVLLLEAGPEAQNNPDITIPNHAARLWRCEVDWHYRSTPQKNLLPVGRRMELEQGKTLGGSTCLNYMVWVRGQPGEFD